MDLRTVKTELTNYLDYSDDYLRDNVRKLILEINDFIDYEAVHGGSERYATLIEDYKIRYEVVKAEYDLIPTDGKNLLRRVHKVQEILTIYDSLVSFTRWAINKCKGFENNVVVRQLETEYDAAKSSSFNWGQILSSLNSEIKYWTERCRARNLGLENEKED